MKKIEKIDKGSSRNFNALSSRQPKTPMNFNKKLQ